jgi:hypothetical protein
MMNSAYAACGFVPRAQTQCLEFCCGAPALQPALYHFGSDEALFVLASDDWDRHDEPAIVGMWRFELLGPNRALVDDGYAQ